jgi:hypothetical protein
MSKNQKVVSPSTAHEILLVKAPTYATKDGRKWTPPLSKSFALIDEIEVVRQEDKWIAVLDADHKPKKTGRKVLTKLAYRQPTLVDMHRGTVQTDVSAEGLASFFSLNEKKGHAISYDHLAPQYGDRVKGAHRTLDVSVVRSNRWCHTIDLDKITPPQGFDPDRPLDSIEAFFPALYHGCEAVWQYSSSYGVPYTHQEESVEIPVYNPEGLEVGKTTISVPVPLAVPNDPTLISAHVTFIFEGVCGGESFKAHMEQTYPAIEGTSWVPDYSTLGDGEILFVSNPIFKGGATDPVSKRLFWRSGAKVKIPEGVVTVEEWLAAQEATRDSLRQARLERDHKRAAHGWDDLDKDLEWVPKALAAIPVESFGDADYSKRISVCWALKSLFEGSQEGYDLWVGFCNRSAQGSKWTTEKQQLTTWQSLEIGDFSENRDILCAVAGWDIERHHYRAYRYTSEKIQKLKAAQKVPRWSITFEEGRNKIVAAGSRPAHGGLYVPPAIDGVSKIDAVRAYVAALTTVDAEGNPVPPLYDGSDLWQYDTDSSLWKKIEVDPTIDFVSYHLGIWESAQVPCGWEQMPQGHKLPRIFKVGQGSGSYAQLTRALLADLGSTPKDVWDSGVYGVALKDVFLRFNLDTKKVTKEKLGPHHYQRHKHDFSWDEVMNDAPTPLWDGLCAHLFTGPDEREVTDFVHRWAGLALFGLTTVYQIPALIFQSVAGTGKSVFGLTLKDCFAPGEATTVKPSEFADDNKRIEFATAKINFVDELPKGGGVFDSDHVKAIVFGSFISSRPLYKKLQNFRPKAAHLWMSNHEISLPGGEEAILDRLCVIKLNCPSRRGVKGQDNKTLLQDIKAHEKVRIIGRLIRTVMAWAEDGAWWEQLERAKEAEKEMQEATPEMEFFHEFFELDPHSRVLRSSVDEMFAKWAQSQRISFLQPKTVYTRWTKKLGTKVRKVNNTVWIYGLRRLEVEGIPDWQDLPTWEPDPVKVQTVEVAPPVPTKTAEVEVLSLAAFEEFAVKHNISLIEWPALPVQTFERIAGVEVPETAQVLIHSDGFADPKVVPASVTKQGSIVPAKADPVLVLCHPHLEVVGGTVTIAGRPLRWSDLAGWCYLTVQSEPKVTASPAPPAPKPVPQLGDGLFAAIAPLKGATFALKKVIPKSA